MKPEYHKLIMADSALAVTALFVFFLWGWQAAVCILFSALVLSGVFVSEIRRREEQATRLSDEIDRILDGEEHWNLDDYSEGELAILQDKVRKLVIRLADWGAYRIRWQNYPASGTKTRRSKGISARNCGRRQCRRSGSPEAFGFRKMMK